MTVLLWAVGLKCSGGVCIPHFHLPGPWGRREAFEKEGGPQAVTCLDSVAPQQLHHVLREARAQSSPKHPHVGGRGPGCAGSGPDPGSPAPRTRPPSPGRRFRLRGPSAEPAAPPAGRVVRCGSTRPGAPALARPRPPRTPTRTRTIPVVSPGPQWSSSQGTKYFRTIST